jgi:hypothetical protein
VGFELEGNPETVPARAHLGDASDEQMEVEPEGQEQIEANHGRGSASHEGRTPSTVPVG